MATTTEQIPSSTGFDPGEFWDNHKPKILLYTGLIVLAIIAITAYEYSSMKTAEAAAEAFSSAKTPDDYRKVVAKYPNSESAGNAMLLLAGSLRDEKKYEESDAQLKSFIERFPNHPLISGGYLSLANNYAIEGKTQDAINTLKDVETKFADSYAAPLALYTEASLQKAQGKMDEARRIYESINSQYPESICSRLAVREIQMMGK